MFAKGMRADTEFGDESDTAQGITPTHHQFATSTARAATAQNWFSPALNHAEASAKAAAFYLSAFRTPHSALRNSDFLPFPISTITSTAMAIGKIRQSRNVPVNAVTNDS